MVTHSVEKDKIWDIIKDIPDPEIPVLTLTDLGVIQAVSMVDDLVEVTITPTYIGCPAMKVFEDDIISTLKSSGYEKVKVKAQLSPAWTTDWMSEEGKKKLKEYGIAPPVGSADKTSLKEEQRLVQCPLCSSMNTELISQFGSTPCKSLYKCNDCKEPFDYFKCI